MITINPDPKAVISVLSFLIRFTLNYIRYSMLASVVLLIVFFLSFALISYNPNVNFSFLKILSPINSVFSQSNYSIGNSEILEVFFYLSLAFTLLSGFFNFLFKLITKNKPLVSYKTKAIISVIFVFILYIISIFQIASKNLEFGFYITISLFFVFAVICLIIFFSLGFVIEKISQYLNKAKDFQDTIRTGN